MTWWLMKIGLERCILMLVSSIHILFKFFWHPISLLWKFENQQTFHSKHIYSYLLVYYWADYFLTKYIVVMYKAFFLVWKFAKIQ
jgi:hypothetical protein